MKCIFLLSGEDLDLAREEVLALAGTSDYWMFDNVLILEADFRFKRLAMTRKVYQHLFECSYETLGKRMEEYDWKRVYENDFSLRITNLAETELPDKEAELAKHIWRRVKEPRVDLKHAKTRIEVIVTGEKVFVGKVIEELPHEFNKRRPSLRPGNHPTTMGPKLARACVNLSGVSVGKIVVDPFCGTGGMLIEAGMMRFNTVGYDISDRMLKLCQKNLEFHGIKRFHLERRDATRLTRPVDYVVTDLPYGKGSHVTAKIDELYADFLKVLWDILKYKAVLIFPDFIDHKELLAKTDFIVENTFNIYVHKSLSRNIVVLSRPVK
ncbi:MAG: DNA methyltransferase [Candidatus Woesearchaeota archaeon]